MTLSAADTAVLAICLLALAISAMVIIRAWLVSRAKRRRLAAAYANLVVRRAAEPLERGQLVADAGASRVRRARAVPMPRQPLQAERALVTSDEGPSLNLPLVELLVEVSSSPAPAPDASPEPFTGGGGEFGGGGASGGWDAPSDSGSYSSDSGSGVGSGD